MASQNGAQRGGVSIHHIRAGETLDRVARDHGVHLPDLLRANPQIVDPNLIRPGQLVHLPAGAHAHGQRGPFSNAGSTSAAHPNQHPHRLASRGQKAAATPINGPSPAAGVSAAGFAFIYNEEHVDGVSEHLHWPTGASGVTLGSGYDMRYRNRGQIVRELGSVGVSSDQATLAAGGSRKTGDDARNFARDNRAAITLDSEQEKRLLAINIRDAVATVAQTVKVPLTQNQHDALVSLVFNIGGPHFRGSSVLRNLNAGDYAGAAAAMRMWNKSGGAVSDVLTRRRTHEIAMFNKPDAIGPRAVLPASPAKGGTPLHHAGIVGDGSNGGRFADIVRRRGDNRAVGDFDAGKMVIVGIRTPTTLNVNGGKGAYDDVMAIVRATAAGVEAVTVRSNTEPSTQYLYRKSPGDVNGDGRPDLGQIETGQTIRYKLDSFLGHEALKIPPSDMVKVRRDVNHDNRMDVRDPVSSVARAGGMHIHIGGVANTWSSGCQTLPPDEHSRFFGTLRRWDAKQKDFYYVIVDAPG